MFEWFRFDLQLFAANGGDGGGSNTGGDGDGGNGDGDQGNAGGAGTDDGRTFTQADIDRVVQQRLARERKTWEQQLEDERKKAAMTEAERLKAEKEEAERKAAERVQAANQRILNAEAKIAAASLGVKPERVDYALRLADLSKVEFDDDGNPDGEAVKSAIEKVVADLPELKGAPAKVGGSSNPPGGGNEPKDLAQQIAEAERKGDWNTARRLKLQQMAQLKQWGD